MTDNLDAEKLMVLGRLAGGVAHDFNNQLTSIIGYADLLLEDLPQDAPSRADLLEIRKAAERAHLITTHLLAFNRPREPEAVLVSMAATLMSHMHLLKRVLGEDIQIVTAIDRQALDEGGDLVRADPSHLGQVLLCLGVEARQALPHGGTLTVETRHVAASVRVTISTTDGASSSNAPGPGRAIVETLVRQAGGDARFESTSTGGLQVTIDLPRLDRPAGDIGVHDTSPRGLEQVLIVENDTGVRDVMRRVLERHGYSVRLAERPRDAVAITASTSIDLAIVDVLLPDERGEALARALIATRPGLRVLFICGREQADAPAVSLWKPFSPHALLIAVRQAIDSAPPSAADQR